MKKKALAVMTLLIFVGMGISVIGAGQHRKSIEWIGFGVTFIGALAFGKLLSYRD